MSRSKRSNSKKRKAPTAVVVRKRGRPTTYDPWIAGKICVLLSQGKTLRQICRENADCPNDNVVREWMIQFPEFRVHYAISRDRGLDAMAEQIIDIASDGRNDWYMNDDGMIVFNREHVMRSTLRVNTLKWYLSKLAPRRYSDQSEVIAARVEERLAELQAQSESDKIVPRPRLSRDEWLSIYGPQPINGESKKVSE